jgi:hypothetical protein
MHDRQLYQGFERLRTAKASASIGRLRRMEYRSWGISTMIESTTTRLVTDSSVKNKSLLQGGNQI